MSFFFPKGFQKMVLVVRTDVNMSVGKIASQCAHAALEGYLKSSKGFVKGIGARTWLVLGQPKIVLRIENEKELLCLADQAKKIGLNTCLIRDAGKTQVKPGTITVLGIGPGSSEKVDSVTSHLRLL